MYPPLSIMQHAKMQFRFDMFNAVLESTFEIEGFVPRFGL
jgi:hypothetical protein